MSEHHPECPRRQGDAFECICAQFALDNEPPEAGAGVEDDDPLPGKRGRAYAAMKRRALAAEAQNDDHRTAVTTLEAELSAEKAARVEVERERSDQLQEVVAAFYKAWPHAEDLAADWPNGVIGCIETLVQERDAAEARAKALMNVVEAAAKQFRFYEAEHRKKASEAKKEDYFLIGSFRTIRRDLALLKAQTNAEMAAACEAALPPTDHQPPESEHG